MLIETPDTTAQASVDSAAPTAATATAAVTAATKVKATSASPCRIPGEKERPNCAPVSGTLASSRDKVKRRRR